MVCLPWFLILQNKEDMLGSQQSGNMSTRRSSGQIPHARHSTKEDTNAVRPPMVSTPYSLQGHSFSLVLNDKNKRMPIKLKPTHLPIFSMKTPKGDDKARGGGAKLVGLFSKNI